MTELVFPVRPPESYLDLLPRGTESIWTDPDTNVVLLRDYLTTTLTNSDHEATVRITPTLRNWLELARGHYREDTGREATDLRVASKAVEYVVKYVFDQSPQFNADNWKGGRREWATAQLTGDTHPDDAPSWTAPYEGKLADDFVKIRLRKGNWKTVEALRGFLRADRSVVLRHLLAMSWLWYPAPGTDPQEAPGIREASEAADRLVSRVKTARVRAARES